MIEPPQSLVTDEGKIERERERPESGPGPESPAPTAEDLELWRGWAAGSNATLARFGRLALAQAGEIHVEPKDPPCPSPLPASPDPRTPARAIGAIPGANQVEHGEQPGHRVHAGLHPGPGGRAVSPESPGAAARGEATARGCAPPNVHIDAGVGGKRVENRPGLWAALKEVCKAKGTVMVESRSRMARSIEDTRAIARRLDQGRRPPRQPERGHPHDQGGRQDDLPRRPCQA